MRGRSARLALVLALLMMPFAPLATERVAAVEAVAALDAFGEADGDHDDQRLRIEAAAEGVHGVWVRNGSRLMHALWSDEGATLIQASPIADANASVSSHAIDVDGDGRLHVAWTEANASNGSHRLRFLLIDVGNGTLDGSPLHPSAIAIGPQTIVNRSSGDMDEVDIATDSKGAAHLVWIDEHDPLGRFHGTGQVRYAMLVAEQALGYADSPIHDTLLTTTYGDRGAPDIAIDGDDSAIVVWDDVRGSTVELVFVLPSDGSNMRVWRDICTILYGGANSGTGSESLKDVARTNGIDVLETLYGLHDFVPNALGNGDDCTGKNTGQRSRTSTLTASDHSGGLRRLHDTIFNGQAPVGWRNEIRDWGPGTTWACLSYRDASGNIPGDPPTTHDHKWHADAEMVVLPVGQYGPFAGGASMDANDDATIREAHDDCEVGGVDVEVIRHDSNSGSVIDAMIDLVHCPENGVDTQRDSRDCDGSTVRETDLRGDLIDWRDSNGDLTANWLDLSAIANRGQRSIWMTALDPYGKLDNDLDWVSGTSAHHETQGDYQEDIGRGRDGHLIVVNDTSLSLSSRNGSDSHPAIDVDANGDLHVVWMSTGHASPYRHDMSETEIEHRRYHLPDLSRTDGEADGLEAADFGGRTTPYTTVSEYESDVGRGFADAHPDIEIDADGVVHIVHTDQNSTDADRLIHSELVFSWDPQGRPTVVRSTMSTYEADRFDVTDLPRTDARTSMSGRGADLAIGGGGIFVGYDDRTGCDNGSLDPVSSVCVARMVPALHRFVLAANESVPVQLQPGGIETVSILLQAIPGSDMSIDVEVSTSWLSGDCDDWSIRMVDPDDGGTIAEGTRLTGAETDSIGIDLTIVAPSASQVSVAHDCTAAVSGVDSRLGSNGAFASIEIPASVVVEHELSVSTIQDSIEIEQGLEGAFTIEIENGGNIWIDAEVANSSTPQGVTIWGLPFGWSILFLESIRLSPGQSTTSTLRVSVPTDQSPIDATLHLVVTTAQDPTSTISEGTRAELDLDVRVKHRREGNIAMEIYDTTEEVGAGECADFSFDVMKRYTAGDIILSIEEGPEDMPPTVLESMWRRENWTYAVDLSEAPGDPGQALSTPRHWGLNERHPIGVTLCAPFHALAGAEGLLSLRASLAADAAVHDEVTFRVTVLPTRAVDIQVASPTGRIEAAPGDRVQVTLSIANDGNVAEPIELAIDDGSWMLQVAEDAPGWIEPRTIADVSVFVTLPSDAAAGSKDLNVSLDADGGSVGNGTIPFTVERRVDLSLGMEGVNLAPLRRGVDARFDLVVRNEGNAPDAPTLSLHARGANGSISESPYLGDLSDLTFTWIAEDGENGSSRVLEIDDHRHAILGDLPIGGTIPVTLLVSSPPTSSAPQLGQHQIGAKVHSIHGGSAEGGDIDESPSWFGAYYDNNEAILIVEFESPDLRIGEVVTEGNPSGDSTVTITVENHGNAAVTNVVLQLCADDDAAAVLANGCSGFALRAVIPVLDAAAAGTVATRELSIQLNPQDGLDWVIVVDPEGALGDLSREGDTAVVSIDPLAEEEDGFQSIFGSESGIMRNAMFGLWIMIGLIIGLTVVRRIRRRAAGKSDPWTGESSMWSGEAATRDEARERRDIARGLDSPVLTTAEPVGAIPSESLVPRGTYDPIAKSRDSALGSGMGALANDLSRADANDLVPIGQSVPAVHQPAEPTSVPPTADIDLSALGPEVEDAKPSEPSIDDLLDGLI